jgi:hypothetical protein
VDANLRIVTHLPLDELWRDDRFSTNTRGRSLTPEDVRWLLASGPVQFVVADVGAAPRWIATRECFHFWKNEAKAHVATDVSVSLDDFPGGYCYFATQWGGRELEVPIVVLEKHH